MFLANLPFGFGMIFIAAVAGGVFGLQYRVMRRYTVENSSLLSLLFATVVLPLIIVWFVLPDWWSAITEAGFKTNALVYVLGFGWGLGAITYAYGFNILGMALAATIIKGLTIIIGSGVPLFRRWDDLLEIKATGAITWTFIGIGVLVVGTILSGWAGVLREREQRQDGGSESAAATSTTVLKPTGRIFWLGMFMCLLSGVLSACANLGYEFAEPLQDIAERNSDGEELGWKATLIRWMPMYWGGISALVICMGYTMIKNGTWRNYMSVGSLRDFCISAGMGCVHVLAQLPYGVGENALGELGTTVGWGANIGMALIVATGVGFFTGEWKGASKRALTPLILGILILLAAVAALGYANFLENAARVAFSKGG